MPIYVSRDSVSVFHEKSLFCLFVCLFCSFTYICFSCILAEIDMDVDSFNTFEVDKVNVIALDYDMPAGAFSKSVFVLS